MQHLKLGVSLQNGKYRIERVLGQGSFGITYQARHEFLNCTVAIKEFFMKELNSRGVDGNITGMTDGSLSYNYARKFRKEAQSLAQIDHSNIVHVTDSFEENGTYYYVMDYIEGQNLNDYIKEHPLSEQEAVSIILKVANALQYMHEEKHMLHLDLKPGNIMRRASDGHIFLIDFGLSKHYSSDGEPETSTTIGLGTPGYAPIEQGNQAKSGEFRPIIDVYALGATLFKLLTGETPPLTSEIISGDEIIVSKLKAHGVCNKLISVVTSAMLLDAKKRTQAVNELINALLSENETTITDTTQQNTPPATLDKMNETSEETDVINEVDEERGRSIVRYNVIGKGFVLYSCLVVSVLVLIWGFVSAFQKNEPEMLQVENVTIVLDTGHESKRSFVYSGDIDSTGVPNGQGTAKYPETKSSSSSIFTGTFINGIPSDGEMSFSTGEKFNGNFDTDGNYINGTYWDKEGYYFSGTFNNGQPYNGTWYDPQGNEDSKVINGI